jgi:hypothetical protein
MVSSDDITTDPAPAEESGPRARPLGVEPGRLRLVRARPSGRGAHASATGARTSAPVRVLGHGARPPAHGARVSTRGTRVSSRGAHAGASSRGIVGRGRVGSARTRATEAGPVAPPIRLHAEAPPLKHAAKRDARTGVRARRAAFGAAAVVLIVVSALVGAVLFGGRSAPAGSPLAAVALATRAATSWVDGAPFTGPRGPGVPADLGRSGPAPEGIVEAVRAETSGAVTSVLFIVAPASGRAYGLSVIIDHGRIAYPVTVTPLPFTTSIPVGTTSVVPGRGARVEPSADGPAQAWAAGVFGAPGHPADALGYGVAGSVQVLEEWRPTTGAAFVTRVLVRLSGPGPGPTVSPATATARAAVADDTRTVARAEAAVRAAAEAVAADQKALTTVTGVQHTAAAAARAAGAAHPHRAAREARAAAVAQSEVAADQTRLTAAAARQAAARKKLASADRARTAAQTSLARADATSSTVTSVYDVAYDTGGRATAWAPADYRIGPT